MEHNHKSGEHHACECASSAPCTQTLDDMAFERGIWYAAQQGDIEKVKLLAKRGVDVVDGAGYTALHHAARAGHTKICQFLINYGACLNAQTRAALATPLHRAVTAGKIDVVKLLIASGADVLLKDGDGQTCLHRAAAEGRKDIAEILVAISRQPLSEADNRGRLPRDLASLSRIADNADFLKLFV